MKNNQKLAINGGRPTRTKPWPSYIRGNVNVTRTQLKQAQQIYRHKRFFRYDDRPFNATAAGQFESKLCHYFHSKHALAITSGTTAIATALLATGIAPGSLVACPAFTFAATPSAILLAKCKPLLIEIDQNLHLDLNDLKRKYTPEVKAILPVHMRGMACDMQALMQFAQEKQLYVVEDNATACGAAYNGKQLGTFGDIGTFSIQSDKFINSGEGGFLVTDNTELFKRALVYAGSYVPGIFSHFSTMPESKDFALNYPIYSFRIDEIRAALALSQIGSLDSKLKKQSTIYHNIVNKLQQLPQIAIRQPTTEDSVLGNKLVFRVPGIDANTASWIARTISAEGIDATAFGDPDGMNQRAFWNWHFLENYQGAAQMMQQLPKSYQYISEAIDIPLSIKLKAHDIQDLVDAIDKVLSQVTI